MLKKAHKPIIIITFYAMLLCLKFDSSVRVYSLASKYGDCSIRVYQVLHNITLHIMLDAFSYQN